MNFVANMQDKIEADDSFFAWMELDCPCPSQVEPAAQFDVPAAFGEGIYEAPAGVLYGDMFQRGLDRAALVVRLAEYAVAPALHALAERDRHCFDLAPFVTDACGERCLIAASLEAYWRLSEFFGGGGALADQYADAVAALLAGGASRRVTCGLSLWATWPVVSRVWQRTSVRLVGWASRDYERRCWASVDVGGVAEAAAQEDLRALVAVA